MPEGIDEMKSLYLIFPEQSALKLYIPVQKAG